MELGGEPPALPGHDTADQKVSLAILFIYSSLLLHTFQTLLSRSSAGYFWYFTSRLGLNEVQIHAKF